MQIGKGGHKGANLWYKRRILTTEKGGGGIGQKEEMCVRTGEDERGRGGEVEKSDQLSVTVGSFFGEGKGGKRRGGDGARG